jgi:serine protease Do
MPPNPSRRIVLAMLAGSLAAGCSVPSVTAPPSLATLIARAMPAVAAIGDEKAVYGTGFRLRGTSFIATAAHVLRPLSGPPQVKWRDQRWPARVVIEDATMDLALLEIDEAAPIPGLALAEPNAPPRPGAWIVVLGCPFGAGVTATTGIVSATPGAILEPESLRSRIQLNAAVNPGNSGGPVLDMHGKVVGIANATIPGGFGLGFAVQVDDLRALLAQADRKR